MLSLRFQNYGLRAPQPGDPECGPHFGFERCVEWHGRNHDNSGHDHGIIKEFICLLGRKEKEVEPIKDEEPLIRRQGSKGFPSASSRCASPLSERNSLRGVQNQPRALRVNSTTFTALPFNIRVSSSAIAAKIVTLA